MDAAASRPMPNDSHAEANRVILSTLLPIAGMILLVAGLLGRQISEVKGTIETSDSNRQADARALNARVDGALAQIRTHEHP